jgi:isoamylase
LRPRNRAIDAAAKPTAQTSSLSVPESRVRESRILSRWARHEGSPYPLGVTRIEAEQAYNFCIYARSASEMRLVFFSDDDWTTPVFTFGFDPRVNKTGPVWHARIPQKDIRRAHYYAYQCNGSGDSGPFPDSFRPNKLLVDPYARAIFLPPIFDRLAAYGTAANFGKALLGVLPKEEAAFHWGSDPRPRHDHDLVIYEMHVRGFTRNANSRVAVPEQGTFKGVIRKIPHLLELGVTAVELMPVFQFDESEPNYWGYMPLSFFAPHAAFAAAKWPGQQIFEFKEMVRALHEADIEVILDVVYNHTGEGKEDGPTINFKGIDCATYYIYSGNPAAPFADFSGTGNTLNCANRVVRQLIVDSLRYWVREMHVDGFRFDLASVFSRNSDGSINFDDPPIFGDIGADPELQNIRLIAEPWEGNPKYPNYELGGGQSGGKPSFPGRGWRQWNDVYRTTVRQFVKSDAGKVPDLMTRVYGSADFFPDNLKDACRPYQSLNYVASHDGLTMYDLVSYTSVDSWNSGEVDGEAGADEDVRKLRRRQVRNFCSLLMLSNGTPMFRAGDEFLQTQYGNPNPYSVDGPLTWLDWSLLESNQDIFDFFSKMIRFRKRHPSIGRSTFWRDDVRWYGTGKDVDLSWGSHAFAYCLHGASLEDDDLYVMINGFWEPLEFEIQEARKWARVIDTFLESTGNFADEASVPPLGTNRYIVQPRSVVVLVSRNTEQDTAVSL